MALYIIEHMEPKLWKWCEIEYRHISKIVGKKNLIFTNVKDGKNKLKKLGKVDSKSVSKIKMENPCLLDPNAKTTLKPTDKFETFVFGGILGDEPPKARTEQLVHKLPKMPRRNLGKKQMSTDAAVLVTKTISSGTSFSKIKFKDTIEININSYEAVVLPYRYVLKNGKPILAPGLVKLLKTQKGF